MKLVRKTNKVKRRLVYVILTFIILIVLVIWGFQMKAMFAKASENRPETNFADVKRGLDFAKTVEELLPGNKQSFSEVIEQAQLSVKEQLVKDQARSLIAAEIIEQLESGEGEGIEAGDQDVGAIQELPTDEIDMDQQETTEQIEDITETDGEEATEQ